MGFRLVWNHSLDHLSTERARPSYSTKNRVNGNGAHLLDERLRFGSAGTLISASWVMPNCYVSSWLFISHHLFFNSDNINIKFLSPCNTVILSAHRRQRSDPYYWRLYLIRALLQTPCHFFGNHTSHFWASIWAADWKFETLLLRFCAGRWESLYRLISFPCHILRSTRMI